MFETLIYDISHDHPLVVLGDKDLHPDDPAGRAIYVSAWPANSAERPARIVLDAQTGRMLVSSKIIWEDIFIDLARASQMILLIPAASEGVRREISLLRDNSFGHKTVVYMWPAKDAHPYKALGGSHRAWEELRGPLESHGLPLPEHRPRGALILLNNDFTIRTTLEPLPTRNVLSPLPLIEDGQAPPLKDIVHLIRDYEIAADPDRFGPMWGLAPDTDSD